jgi:hypothetical protein
MYRGDCIVRHYYRVFLLPAAKRATISSGTKGSAMIYDLTTLNLPRSCFDAWDVVGALPLAWLQLGASWGAIYIVGCAIARAFEVHSRGFWGAKRQTKHYLAQT